MDISSFNMGHVSKVDSLSGSMLLCSLPTTNDFLNSWDTLLESDARDIFLESSFGTEGRDIVLDLGLEDAKETFFESGLDTDAWDIFPESDFNRNARETFPELVLNTDARDAFFESDFDGDTEKDNTDNPVCCRSQG